MILNDLQQNAMETQEKRSYAIMLFQNLFLMFLWHRYQNQYLLLLQFPYTTIYTSKTPTSYFEHFFLHFSTNSTTSGKSLNKKLCLGFIASTSHFFGNILEILQSFGKRMCNIRFEDSCTKQHRSRSRKHNKILPVNHAA